MDALQSLSQPQEGLGLGPQSLEALVEVPSHVALCVLQAEGWVRGKLRDLKDGCDLQDWEEVAQTLQRDMKDFENTLIKLNQVRPGMAWRGVAWLPLPAAPMSLGSLQQRVPGNPWR